MPQERQQPKRESPEEIAKKKTEKTADKKPTDKKPAPKADAKKPAAKKPAPKKPADKKPEAKKPEPKKPAAKPKADKPKADEKPKRRAPRRRRGAAEESAAPKRDVRRPVVHAHAKYVRSSARKARLVINHIRGKTVDEARATLRHHSRGVASDIHKLLESAVANAENNHELVADDLLVKEISADEGPTLRRFRPRAQGRATRIRKRTAHLSIALTTKD